MTLMRSNRCLCSAFAMVVFSLAVMAMPAQSGNTGKVVFDAMVEALGGRAFLNVKEIQANGRFFTFRRDEIATSDLYADYLRFPDMERTEFGREKQKRVQINRGKEGWNVSPNPNGKGAPEVKEQSAGEINDFLENFKTSFDYMMRFVVNTPRATLLLTGTEVVDYKRTDVLEIRDSAKNLLRVYVDRETHLPVKTQMRRADNSLIHEEAYANWHKFDGVMTPLMVTRYKDGVKTMEIRTEKASYDSGLADSLFAPPAVPAK